MTPEGTSPSASQTVELEFTYTRDEFVRATVAATQDHFRQRRFFRWLGPALILLAIVAAFSPPGGIQAGWRPAAFPAGFGLFFMLFPWLAAHWTARRSFRRLPTANARISWRIGPDLLTAEAPNGTTTFAWGAVHRTRETKHGLLLFTNPAIAQWLPRTAFKSADDLARVRAWIALHQPDFGRGLAAVASTPPPLPLTPQTEIVVEASYIQSFEVAEQARRAVLASASRWVRPIRWAVPFVAVLVVSVPYLLRGDWLPIAIFLPIVAIAFIVSIGLGRATRARIFAQSPDANLEIQVLIDAEHIEVRGRSGTSRQAWSGIIRVRETPDGFILQTQPGTARYLPKSAFRAASDLEQVRAWIRAKNIPTM